MTSTLPPSVGRNYFKFMQWDITTRCNLKCAHCRSTEFYSDGDVRDLCLSDNKRILNDLFLNGVMRIHFLGGEPLMRGDFCEFVEYADSLGIIWSVNTNGTLLGKKMARRLLDANAFAITVSLDGPTAASNDAVRGAGVFDKVCKNIADLSELRTRQNKPTRIIIACTLVRQNAAETGRMLELAKSLNVNSLILSELQMRGSAKKSAPDLQVGQPAVLETGHRVAQKIIGDSSQQVQLGFLTPIAIQYINEAHGTAFPIYDASCGALTHKGFIQPDGALFPCQSLTDKEKVPGAIGPMRRLSLADHNFHDLWYSKRYEKILQQLFSPDIDRYMLPCRYCKYFRKLCYPCPLSALSRTYSVRHQCLAAMSELAAARGVDAPWNALLNQLSGDDDRIERYEEEVSR